MASIINATVTSPGGLVTTGDNTNELKIQTGETDAVTVNSSQVVAFNNPIVVAGNNISADNSLGFRNRIINGDMRIDQRNAGAAITSSGAFPVDRFFVTFDTDGAFSAQQDSSAPTGFINSLKFTTTTADASLGATQYAYVRQIIEGTNVADLGWGTASAKTVTLSFWVRSSLTGTFGGSLWNNAFNRSYPFTYTISVADTWEYKTITVAGDTTGTWLTTNGRGINVGFGLGVGSTYSGTAGAWAAAGYVTTTGATSVIGTLNATWYITGVQLEVGSVATPFERRPYGTELALCQRYAIRYCGTYVYESICPAAGQASTSASALLTVPVPMRTQPSITYSGTFSLAKSGGNVTTTSFAIDTAVANSKSTFFTASASSGLVAGYAYNLIAQNDITSSFLLSAEL